MIKDRCYRGGKMHRFEARYEKKKSPLLEPGVKIKYFHLSELLIDVYIHDVCVWCGKVVNK